MSSSIGLAVQRKMVEIPESLLELVGVALNAHGLEIRPHIRRGVERLAIRYSDSRCEPSSHVPHFLRFEDSTQ